MSSACTAQATVMITRPLHQSREMVLACQSQGFSPCLFPTIDIVPLSDYQAVDRALESLNSYDWLILTSRNGVFYFLERLKALDIKSSQFKNIRLACVGEKTAEALQVAGFKVDLVPQKFTSESLVKALKSENINDQSILCLRANIALPQLPQTLRAVGAKVNDLSIYKTQKPDTQALTHHIQALLEGQVNYLTFTSPSAIEHFADLFSKKELKQISGLTRTVSIGPVTSKAAGQILGKIDLEAQTHTVAGLLETIKTDWQSR